ncbi:4-(cytidine 5'-diphospho)-2-C-methyl-D-erythritol kinase [Pontibacter sp. BT310]|uniref:4-diphosphocytidyl-2-C-methyl-D-erythritol kinase n=1 Tax=Pontibacter populi TaxID=890055 RepID=A0ABS6XC52_9BACT|nr:MULTISPECIES: 4-(cytidine 5'-diphospho)-2-C-methyl-D-erythritol kinase [Pontibacter]MBJ6118748.1 4-(cytidine 5'-diphospho)-2-C-methyl-D-erythritol kinase [Pontibacter sp. BT310]MBR0571177.1 4-(cytidine 5'-diphospho)-2-C-methyl-D-erythritol kinase [Microvirga sp. STS03]MBW3365602.1 4-(cytidine 5'-diphospho)-2-C-methyl-D-erythritol kinase [Pontibacter populi]
MLDFPNAKINLGLQIIEKRPDGFHNLESCFYPVQWCDALEVLPAAQNTFTMSGLPVPGDTESNLCLKAYKLLEKAHNLPPVHMHLHKVIPMGAGLGGGSADAAFVLRILNKLFDLNLTIEQLQNYACQLGSDCAFFIENKPVIAVERGDVFMPAILDLSGYSCVVVYPDIHITTAEAYAGVTPEKPSCTIEMILKQDIKLWKDIMHNDFEKSLFPKYPELAALKENLYEAGAVYASMTGSGSAVYGIFKGDAPANLIFPKNWLVWKGLL